MSDLQTFNTGENASTIRAKINAVIQRVNSIDDANEIIAKIDNELGSTGWKESLLTIDTLADLAAYDVGPVDNKTVAVVYGKDIVGDGEGGTYYWDQSSTKTANGLTVIAPSSGDSGRWIKVQAALSGIDIRNTIVGNEEEDTSLSNIKGIKDWVEKNASVSDLQYFPIASYDGTPSVNKEVGTNNGVLSDGNLSYRLAVGGATATYITNVTYNINNLKTSTGQEISNPRLLFVECFALNGSGASDVISQIECTMPDGEFVPLLDLGNVDWPTIDGTHKAIVTIPLNSDTSEVKFRLALSAAVGEYVGFKIIGATSVTNASGLLGNQIYGGSGMLYSGETVFEGASPTTETELNLKGKVNKGGRHFVTLKIENTDSLASTYYVKPFDETTDTPGGGISHAQVDANNVAYLTAITDSDVKLLLNSSVARSTTITLESYQPLDDSPVVTRHYLGDIEFIDEVVLISPEDQYNAGGDWVSVSPNLGWAGASNLLVYYQTADIDNNATNQSLGFRASLTGEHFSIGDQVGSRDGQCIIPVSSSGAFQWKFESSSARASLRHLKVVGYIKENPIRNAYPYWKVRIDTRNNLTLPSQFDDGGASQYGEPFRYPSYGNIENGYGSSQLYTMQINVLEDTTVTQKLTYVDDQVYVYIDDDPGPSRTSLYTNTGQPIAFEYPLSKGIHTIKIVKNNAHGGASSIQLLGDIISDTVQFVGSSDTFQLLEDLNGTVDHETVPTSQATKNYVDGQVTGDLSENGWTKLPNGLIMQWGTTSPGTDNTGDPYTTGILVTYPIPFPSGILNIVTGMINATANNPNYMTHARMITDTNFRMVYDTTDSSAGTIQGSWQAIGY